MAKQKPQFLAALNSISAPPAQASAAPVAAVVPQQQDAAPPRYFAPSRQGKTLVAAHLPPQYKRTLKMLSAQTDKSQEMLLKQALEMLFTAQRIDFQ